MKGNGDKAQRNPAKCGKNAVPRGKTGTKFVCYQTLIEVHFMPVTTEVRVRYAETDQMAVVYYANYFVWFEVGRVELFRALGFSYKLLEREHGCILPVVDARCRYRSSARYDEQILIETQPLVVRGSLVKFAYRVLRKDSGEGEPALLAEGETTHVVCDAKMKKKPLPEKYAAALRTMMTDE
jgi:acyl-CoA thioester hydrolase